MRIHILSRSLAVWAMAVLLLGGRAEAQSTYTWANSNITATPTSLLDWFTGGANPQGTWQGGDPVSSNLNTIQFFANTTTALTNTVTGTQTVNLNNGGSAFELGTLTLSGLASATTNANLTMTLTGDALNFSGATGTINLNALNATRTITYNVNNAIRLGTAGSGSVLTIGGAGTGNFVLGGVISELQAGGGSLVKNGASTVSLAGANSYTGGTTLNAGLLNLNSASAIGTGSLVIAGGTLGNTSGGAITLSTNNAQTWSGNFGFAGTSDLNLGTGAVSLGAATRTVTVSANTLRIGGVISGGAAVGLTKAGAGTLALDGANTYTGVTTVSAGVLRLNNANSLPGGVGATGGTSNLTLAGGVVGLTSDFSRSIGTSGSQVQLSTGGGGWAAYGADRTVNLGGNETPSTIVWGDTIANGGFNGQGLILGATDSTHTVELVNGLNLGSGANRTVTVNRGTAAFDAKLSGSIIGSGTLTKGGAGVLLITGNNTSFTGRTNISGVVAISNANALGSGTVQINNGGSLASTSATPLTLANPVVVNTSVTLGNVAATGDLVLAGGLTPSGAITLTGLSSVNVTGTVSGVGGDFRVPAGKTLRLGADNSAWSGTKYLQGPGTYVLGHAKALGSGTIQLGDGNSGLSYALIESEVDLTGPNALTNLFVIPRISGGFTLLVGGGFGGTNSIELAGGVIFDVRPRGLTNYISGGSLLISGNVSGVGSEAVTPTLIGTGNTTISGNIVNGGAPTLNFVVQSTGITTFSGTNTYNGTTTVNAGALLLSTTSAISGAAARPYSVVAAGAVGTGFALNQAFVDRVATNAGGAIALGANSANNLNFTSSNGASLGAIGSGTWAYSGTLTQTGTYRLGGGGGTLDFQSALTGANTLIVGGPTTGLGGTVILSGTTSSFTGKTTVQMGTLAVASLANVGAGNVSSLGAPTTTANGTIDLGSGTIPATLRYVGSGHTSNRALNLAGTTGGATLDASGEGALVLTAANTATGAGTKTFTLTGTSTADNSIGVIAGTGVSVNKTGSGRWLLTGANTFTGDTTISGGRLHVSAGDINSTSGVTVNGSGAEFKYNSATAYTKPLTLTQGMISGTGTISASGGVSVGSNVILSPGNSPGLQGYTTGLTWAGGGSYLWEINDWTGAAGTAYDQVAVSGSPLAITASSGSPFTILITSLTGANAAGDVPNFDGSVSKTFTIATSSAGITGFDASNFTLNASGFSNTYSGSWSLASTGSTVLLNYVAGPTTTTGTYSLSASAGAATIIAGGSSTITATIANTGAGTADALNYGSLAVGQGVTISPSSGSNLAQAASGTGTGVFTSSTPGAYTFDPTASVTNSTLGGAAVLSGSTSTSVTVLDHATSSLSDPAVLTSSTISLGTWDYDLQSWTSGSGTNLFSIFNLNPNELDPSFVALLDLTGTSASGDAGFTLDAGLTPGSFTMIAGGTSASYSVSFDPTGLSSQGTFTRTFTFNMADQNLPGKQATNTLSVTATVIVVPEPAAIALLASAALTGWAAWKRRQKGASHQI